MRPLPRYEPALKPLLAEAAVAYRRHDDPVFRALLEKAFRLAPWRLDLGFNLAQHHIQTGMPGMAMEIYRALHDMVPSDAEVLLFLAHWRRYFNDGEGAGTAFLQLEDVRPDLAAALRRLWSVIDRWLAEPIAGHIPALAGDVPFIVILGYLLREDGGMEAILRDRLEKGLEAAAAYPGAAVTVTGGMPRSGRVEAREMREWLMERGVAGERILEEGYSRDVVENALYSRQILDLSRATSVLVVTSPNGFRRVGAAFEIAGWAAGSGWTVRAAAASHAAGGEFADDGRDRLKIYRDALRANGVLMMRSFPELVER